MCGRFTLTNPKAIAKQAWMGPNKLPANILTAPRYNIAPGQRVAMLRQNGKPHFAEALWGFQTLASRQGAAKLLINARLETVRSRPTFAASFLNRRCLIPADGFYEWPKPSDVRSANDRLPRWFTLPGEEVFAFAGVFRSAADQAQLECVVLTGAATKIVKPIHHRMPVILTQHHWQKYLTDDADEAARLLQSNIAPPLALRTVSARINSPLYDDAACIAEAAASPTLF